MPEKSEVGGLIRVSVPTLVGKKTVYATIETSFYMSSEENTKESRDIARAQGRKELQEELEKLVEEVLNPISADLA